MLQCTCGDVWHESELHVVLQPPSQYRYSMFMYVYTDLLLYWYGAQGKVIPVQYESHSEREETARFVRDNRLGQLEKHMQLR